MKKYHNNNHCRILAIDPYRRGFGFAVMEGTRLLDWGLARLFSKKDDELLGRVEALLTRYAPTAFTFEDGSNARRGEAAMRRVNRLISFASLVRIPVTLVSREDVRRAFGIDDQATNHDVATQLTALFPELASLLPQKRKFYDSEDERMNVFRAVALASAGAVSCASA